MRGSERGRESSWKSPTETERIYERIEEGEIINEKENE